jgi:hypothetical protein
MHMENELARVLRLGMALVVSVGLAACAPETEEELDTPETSTPDVTTTPAPEPMTVDLQAVENSNVSGDATLTRSGESIMVALTLENLPSAGPFQAQLISGRCENGGATTPAPSTPAPTTPAPGARGTTPSTQTPPATGAESGRVLATLESIQVTGTAPAQNGMSHSTVAVSSLQGNMDAAIKVTDGSKTIACGNLSNIGSLTSGTTTAPGTPSRP